MANPAPPPLATPAMSMTLAELSQKHQTKPAPLHLCVALPLPAFVPADFEPVPPGNWNPQHAGTSVPLLQQVVTLPLVQGSELVGRIQAAIHRHVPKVNVGGHYALGPKPTFTSAWRIRHSVPGAADLGTDPLRFLPSTNPEEYGAMELGSIFERTILAGSDYVLRAERFATLPEITKAHTNGLHTLRLDSWMYMRDNNFKPNTGGWPYGWNSVRIDDRMFGWVYKEIGMKKGATLLALLRSDQYLPARFERLTGARENVSGNAGEEFDDDVMQQITRSCQKERVGSLVLTTGVVYSFGLFARAKDGSLDYTTLRLSQPIACDAFDTVRSTQVAETLPEYGSFRPPHPGLVGLPMNNPGVSIMQTLVFWLLESERRLKAGAILAGQSRQDQAMETAFEAPLPIQAGPSEPFGGATTPRPHCQPSVAAPTSQAGTPPAVPADPIAPSASVPAPILPAPAVSTPTSSRVRPQRASTHFEGTHTVPSPGALPACKATDSVPQQPSEALPDVPSTNASQTVPGDAQPPIGPNAMPSPAPLKQSLPDDVVSPPTPPRKRKADGANLPPREPFARAAKAAANAGIAAAFVSTRKAAKVATPVVAAKRRSTRRLPGEKQSKTEAGRIRTPAVTTSSRNATAPPNKAAKRKAEPQPAKAAAPKKPKKVVPSATSKASGTKKCGALPAEVPQGLSSGQKRERDDEEGAGGPAKNTRHAKRARLTVPAGAIAPYLPPTFPTPVAPPIARRNPKRTRDEAGDSVKPRPRRTKATIASNAEVPLPTQKKGIRSTPTRNTPTVARSIRSRGGPNASN